MSKQKEVIDKNAAESADRPCNRATKSRKKGTNDISYSAIVG